MQTLQERIEELMAARGWTVGKVASVAGVSSSAVSQWLGRGGAKSSKSIGDFEVALRLEKESGYSAMWLAKGKGPKHPEHESTQSKINDKVPMSKDLGGSAKLVGNQGSPEEAVGDLAENESVLCQPIPTSMPISPPNLKSAILLMGSLVGALDKRRRHLIRQLLNDLVDDVDDPDEVKDIAETAYDLALKNKPITKNKDLNKALRGRPGRDPVETKPASLEH